MPKPYKEGDDLNHGDSSFKDLITNESDLEEVFKNNDFKDEKFYFRIKPESYGTYSYLDLLNHTYSYIETRINSQYKNQPGYYGDGDNLKYNQNGVFVIDTLNKKTYPWGSHIKEF